MAQWVSCVAADGEQAWSLWREWSQSVSHQSKNRGTLSETSSLVYSGETIQQSVAGTNSAGSVWYYVQPFVPVAGNANLAPCDCWEEETREKSLWLELATLEAPRKPARGREGGGAEIVEVWREEKM